MFTLSFILFTHGIHAQDQELSSERLDELKGQVTQLVKFLEYSVNTLGNKETPVSEKEVIIDNSYAKIFVDDKVQVEDDLDDKRDVLVYKDVQAYLKDIDFFFKNVSFNFNIENITPQFNDKNNLYFIVTLNRKINGIMINGDTLENNIIRFIEVNYNDLERDLRIASIYSTKFNEKEELTQWWNHMSKEWKNYFGENIRLFDTVYMNDLFAFNDSSIILASKQLQILLIDTFLVYGNDTLPINESDTIYAMVYDTILFDTDLIIREIKKITSASELDIENNHALYDLWPLSEFTNLKKLNCSNTMVHDLTPIRNLSKLESLNCSNTDITDFSMLKYSDKLRNLNINNTSIEKIDVVEHFPDLERFYFQNTPVYDLSYLSENILIKDLRFSNTNVDNLLPIANLVDLKLLDCSETNIRSLQPLQKLTAIERLFCSNTAINKLVWLKEFNNLQTLQLDDTKIRKLEPLNGLESLERIYCDNTYITSEIANQFIEMNPEVLVIYESETLLNWWFSISPNWQLVFSNYIEEDLVPTKEQLHQLANLTKINIAHNGRISGIEPLQKLEKLESLDMSNTIIDNLEPISDHIDLRTLNAANSRVSSPEPLKDLINLEFLDLSNTLIDNVEPLSELKNLQTLKFDNTNVSSLIPLKNSNNLQEIYCDNTDINLPKVLAFHNKNPECLIIYQTEALQNWWNSLDRLWQNTFLQIINSEGDPTTEQLHEISNIEEIDFTDDKNIRSLIPITPLRSLRSLKISGTQINDLSPLQGMVMLDYLDISNNPIQDLSPVSELTSLKYLDIKNTPEQDLSFINNLVNLETLNCAGTNIKDLIFAGNLDNLKRLSFYNTRVKNLKYIERLQNLELIECYNTRISKNRVEKFKESHPDCEIVFY